MAEMFDIAVYSKDLLYLTPKPYDFPFYCSKVKSKQLSIDYKLSALKLLTVIEVKSYDGLIGISYEDIFVLKYRLAQNGLLNGRIVP